MVEVSRARVIYAMYGGNEKQIRLQAGLCPRRSFLKRPEQLHALNTNGSKIPCLVNGSCCDIAPLAIRENFVDFCARHKNVGSSGVWEASLRPGQGLLK
jgi:hypothetical protein